jgi:hypothetical protein
VEVVGLVQVPHRTSDAALKHLAVKTYIDTTHFNKLSGIWLELDLLLSTDAGDLIHATRIFRAVFHMAPQTCGLHYRTTEFASHWALANLQTDYQH